MAVDPDWSLSSKLVPVPPTLEFSPRMRRPLQNRKIADEFVLTPTRRQVFESQLQ